MPATKPKRHKASNGAAFQRIYTRLTKMSLRQRRSLVDRLRMEAEDILAGGYDPEDVPGDNNLWAGDLLLAAGKIARMRATKEVLAAFDSPERGIGTLSATEVEEIEALLD